MLNTQLMDYATAELTCNVAGGHLAYYTSLDEQQDVEGYFQQQGYLMSGFTPSYWIGLTADANTWPNFRWLSSSVPAPAYHTYEHWGRTQDNSEPNNAVGNEYCGAASFPLLHKGAWGWSDSICISKMPFICRLDGRWRRSVQQLVLPLCLLQCQRHQRPTEMNALHWLPVLNGVL